MSADTTLSSSAISARNEYGNEICDELAQKAGGQCYLCEDSLDLSADPVVVDHIEPKGPRREAQNLYIAHVTCNSLKRDLPADKAKVMIKFRKYCEERKGEVSFDDILDLYVPNPKRRSIKLEIDQKSALITYAGKLQTTANVLQDPTTNVKYFFVEVPVSYVHNDVEVQPRKIDWRHAWSLAQDFMIHPVHEPSSCRVDLDQNGVGKLLQFDGQHKTAAQIILGRSSVQTKIYVNPPLPTVRSLIMSIQNRIPKLPLQAAVAISKLADVYRDHWEQTGAQTEEQFVKSYLSNQQANAKRELLSAIYKAILEDLNNKLTPFVQTVRARRGTYPLSMNNLSNLILKELVCQQPQNTVVNSPEDLRPDEAQNVVNILNMLSERLLTGKWDTEPASRTPSRDRLKAERFFTPGAVKYWAPLLRRALAYRLGLTLVSEEEQSRPLLRKLTSEQVQIVEDTVHRLVEHPLWTDAEMPQIDGWLRENRPATSRDLFESKYRPALNVGYIVGVPTV